MPIKRHAVVLSRPRGGGGPHFIGGQGASPRILKLGFFSVI